MQIKIKTLSGDLFTVATSKQSSVGTLKESLVQYCNLPVFQQKLIHDLHLLDDNQIIQECGINEGDVLVLLEQRLKSIPKEEADFPVPTKSLILQHTGGKDLKSPGERLQPTTSPFRNQLQDLMSTLLGFPPSASLGEDEEATPTSMESQPTTQTATLPQRMLFPLVPPVARAPPALVTADPAALQQLKDMGFPENRAKKALILRRNQVQLAMEWLLEHGDDPNIDDPLPEPATATRPERTPTEFVPNPEAVRMLKDMGFAEEDIVTALRNTNNNQEAACSWLLGERDLDEDNSEDASVLQNVLSHPTVQAGLSNPRVLQALKLMLENPSAAHQFINDPEIGPILLQVHNILQNQ